MHNLFIHQLKDNGGATTYMANTGHIAQRNGQAVLLLQNGSTQSFNARGVLNYLTFNEYPFELSQLTNPDEMIHYKFSDRWLHELFKPDLEQSWEKKNRKALLAEGHARLATPLYNIVAMCMALSAIIGGGFSRLGYIRRIVTMGALAVVVRVLGFAAQSASEGAVWVNVLQYAVPLVAIALSMRSVFRQPVSRFIDIRRRPARIAPVAA
jgi:lipopolysaccharide export system permease protein